jgi:hypothetical protein
MGLLAAKGLRCPFYTMLSRRPLLRTTVTRAGAMLPEQEWMNPS